MVGALLISGMPIIAEAKESSSDVTTRAEVRTSADSDGVRPA